MKNSEIQTAFDDLFTFENKDDQYEVDAKLLMAKFLSELQPIIDEKQLKRKELAEMIGTSASYLTQLYRGNKLINLLTLAKLQSALGVSFQIGLEDQEDIANTIDEENIAEHLNKFFRTRDGDFFKVIRNYSIDEKDEVKEPKLPSKDKSLMIA